MPDDITQAEVDALVRDLEAMRSLLRSDRAALRRDLDAAIARARGLRDRALGGPFEPAVTTTHDLLLTLRRGLASQLRIRHATQTGQSPPPFSPGVRPG